jgi:hypothetical protein
VYGFGETEHTSLKYDMNWHHQGMWARDNGVGVDSNLYGVQPYHLTLENSGSASGLLLLNANAQEIDTSPFPYITYRRGLPFLYRIVITGIYFIIFLRRYQPFKFYKMKTRSF